MVTFSCLLVVLLFQKVTVNNISVIPSLASPTIEPTVTLEYDHYHHHNHKNHSTIFPSAHPTKFPSNSECTIYDSKPRQIRILLTSNEKYLPVLFNWLLFFHQTCPLHEENNLKMLYISCLDATTEGMLYHRGLHCSHVYHNAGNSLSDLWLMRVKLTKQLLNDGFDVLLSDSDAIFLHNPFVELQKYITSDIIASRGSFPDEVGNHYGATACMGFIYIKSTRSTNLFYQTLIDNMIRTKVFDDQVGFNKLLMSLSLTYPNHVKYIDSITADTGTFKIKDGSNQLVSHVTLLPHNLFRRICEKELSHKVQQSVVAHCYLAKNAEAKEIGGRNYGIWRLSDRWKDLQYHTEADIDEYLDSMIKGNRMLTQPNDRVSYYNEINLKNMDSMWHRWLNISVDSSIEEIVQFESFLHHLSPG